MSAPLILALPSKGRLMEQCANMLARAGLVVAKSGAARGYKGDIAGLPGVEVNFVSSSEIAQLLKSGAAHLGITGEDLLRETIADCEERITFLRPCGFGPGELQSQVGLPFVRGSLAAYGSVPVPPAPGGGSPSGPLTRAYPTGTG